MAYDEDLAERVREAFSGILDVEEKKMFGGLCFMMAEHMCCGVEKDRLMARVGPQRYDECLKKAHVREMDFTGKPMKGMVFVEAGGLVSDEDLGEWIRICMDFVVGLPPKKKRKK